MLYSALLIDIRLYFLINGNAAIYIRWKYHLISYHTWFKGITFSSTVNLHCVKDEYINE